MSFTPPTTGQCLKKTAATYSEVLTQLSNKVAGGCLNIAPCLSYPQSTWCLNTGSVTRADMRLLSTHRWTSRKPVVFAQSASEWFSLRITAITSVMTCYYAPPPRTCMTQKATGSGVGLCVTATVEKKRGEEFLPTAVVHIHKHGPLNSTVTGSGETQTLDWVLYSLHQHPLALTTDIGPIACTVYSERQPQGRMKLPKFWNW